MKIIKYLYDYSSSQLNSKPQGKPSKLFKDGIQKDLLHARLSTDENKQAVYRNELSKIKARIVATF